MTVAINDQLAPPAENTYLLGQNTIHRYVRCEATVGTAIAFTNLQWVQSVSISEPTYELEYDIMHQGSDEKTHRKLRPKWDVTINVLNGKAHTIRAAFQGITLGATHVGLPLDTSNDNPQIILESVYREDDNETHAFSIVVQDLVLDPMGFDTPMEYADAVIKGHTYYPPLWLTSGYYLVYDKYTATPTTATYQLTATPCTLMTSTNFDRFEFDKPIYVKLKDNSAGDTIGYRLQSGVAFTGNDMVFTTLPAASDVIYCLYTHAT
jgi:hypothetical protein